MSLKSPVGIGRKGSSTIADEDLSTSIRSSTSLQKWLFKSMVSMCGNDFFGSELADSVNFASYRGDTLLELTPLDVASKHI